MDFFEDPAGQVPFIAGLVDSPTFDDAKWYKEPYHIDEDDAEHVLRGSKSFAARSFRSRTSTTLTGNSLRVPSNASQNENFSGQDILRPNLVSATTGSGRILGEIVSNNQVLRGGNGAFKLRPSPTPSLKKKKAEAIVKSHGSPSHVRVTAGGRIVPSEQSPLCQPRYGYSAIKVNGGLIKFAPNLQAGKTQWTQATEDGFVAQDIDGNLCQIVNGQIMPLRPESGGGVSLYMPAPNLRITQHALPPVSVPVNPPPAAAANSNQPAVPQPSISAQITALDRQYTDLEHDLKRLDQTEAIHGRTMTKTGKDNLVKQRRELVTNMDKIRKTLKGLRSRPPPNAPTSPRAMQNRQSMSPPRNTQMPPALLLGQHSSMPAQSFGAGPFFAAPQAALEAEGHLYQTPSPEDVYAGHNWAPVPAGAFYAPPPPFDGSVAPPMGAFPQALPVGIGAPMHPPIGMRIPQHDGAHSFVDIEVPRPSQALSIKAPESKAPGNLKSALNPMSPAYKPSRIAGASMTGSGLGAEDISGRNATPLSPLRQLQPPAQTVTKSCNATDETISPSKRHAPLHSSSISSFETADFFPRNTGEYSAHHQACQYQEAVDHGKTRDGRDSVPVTPADGAWPSAPSTTNGRGRAVPYSTPVFHSDATTQAPLPVRGDHNGSGKEYHDLTDRDAHNMSPKNKRQYIFVQEHPDEVAAATIPSSSSGKTHIGQESSRESSEETINLSGRSRDWVKGYLTGLHGRSAPASSGFDFLDGMCSGYLALKPTPKSSASDSTHGGPLKSHSRRPSPAVPSCTSSRLQQVEKTSRRPFAETATQSADCLKQAVFAEQNENAILTPAIDGLHVNDAPTNLGAWAKKTGNSAPNGRLGAGNESDLPGFPLLKRGAATVDRKGVLSEGHNVPLLPKALSIERASDHLLPSSSQMPLPVSPTTSTKSIASSSIAGGVSTTSDARIGSLGSIDSNMYRQWPGSRILTPGEWRSAGTAAVSGGLNTGYFAHGQFDGTSDLPHYMRMPGQLTMGIPGAPHRVGSVTSVDTVSRMPAGGRFREGSIDRITNPATSPSPMSPTLSATSNTARESSKRNKDGSPRKNPSPTKAKFESLAEKVGIKVSGTDNNDGTSDPVSPSGKRQWRDVWHKGGKDGHA